MDESKSTNLSPEKPIDKDYKKKRVEEIGSTLAQIKARVKANRSCVRKEDDSKSAPREILSEKSEKYIQVLELDKAKAQKLEKDRPKIKEAIENLKIDRENQKLVEKKIEESRAKQSAPLPEIPVEIQKRISDLEITIHNLKETLSEKEKVLESKTDSWRLLSDQLEQRNIEVVERYEMMAKEIDNVKMSYREQEVFLRNELEKCKVKLQDADSQLISRNNSRREYEETVAQLEALKTTHAECENKFTGFKQSQEAEKKLILKLKAQIKNYRNEINSKKGLSEEVDRLKNNIATLEEEKESAIKNQERVLELESSLKNMEVDLNASREQCCRVSEDYKDLCTKIAEKDEMIKSLTKSLEKTEQAKISSEFKAAELEEKLEAENREDRTQNDKMCKEIDNLKCHVKQQEEMVEELKKMIVQKEAEIKSLSDNREVDYSFNYDTQDLKDLLEEWKSKYSKVEKTVSVIEEEKETLFVKVQSLEAELQTERSKYQTLMLDLSQKESAINDYVKSNAELIESLSKSDEKISALEKLIGNDNNTGSKSDNHTQKLKKLAANLKIKVKSCKELEEKVTGLNERLLKQESNIEILTREKSELENAISEYKIKLENVSLDTDVVEQLKNLVSEKEAIIQRLTNEEGIKLHAVQVEALKKARKESYCELVEKDSTIQQLKVENLLLESKLNENLMEIHSIDESDRRAPEEDAENSTNQHSSDKDSDNTMNQPDSGNGSIHSLSPVEKLNEELKVKVEMIRDLENSIADLKSQLDEANMVNAESKNTLHEQKTFIEQLNNELLLLKNFNDVTKSDVIQRHDMLEQVKNLEMELENSRRIINSKEEIIASFQHEMNSLKSEMNQNENQLVKIQEMYMEESNRNDGVISNLETLETELNLSKNEIVSLSEQLIVVSKDYGLCMEKLKEKDLYIDHLEKELDTMRNKVMNFESLINERQKAMEERAKQLGEKLNQASSIGVNFEQYKLDMEHKLLTYDENEKLLNMKINELVLQLEQSNFKNNELIEVNSEHEVNKKTRDDKMKELETELTDIQSAYNMTLDQIEVLNGELNQVMAQIEHRNKELVRIGEERNSLIGRLTEVEDTCNDLRSRLQTYEAQSENLKTELDSKLKELDVATTEISNLQSQLDTNQLTDNSELNKELEVLKNDYEERLRELQVEKDDLLKVIKGSVEPEVDSLMKAAEDKVEKKDEIQLFSWDGHAGSTPLDDMHEDNWGWNASDAKLEEEYQYSEANKVKQVELERDRLKTENDVFSEEVKSLKIKCTKLVAKVKELKAASEKEKNKTGFEDLNFAMQEELRSLVDEADKKNKELQVEISSLKMEKERLIKRVETLTSANNQLIEMKERQDIEVQVWQRNCAELKNQLQTFDWADNETKVEKQTAPIVLQQKSDSKLEDKLTFLETENEELLQIICTLKDEKQANNNLSVELRNLKEENKLLTDKLEVIKQNQIDINELKQCLESERSVLQAKEAVIQQLTESKADAETKLNSITVELGNNREQYNTLLNQVNDSSSSNQQIKCDYELLKNDLDIKCQQIVTLSENVNTLQGNISKLNEENTCLRTICNEKDKELSTSRVHNSQIDLAVKQVEDLQNEQGQLSIEISRLREVVQSLTAENEALRESNNIKVSEVDLLKTDITMCQASKDAAINEVQTLREEINRIQKQNVIGNTAAILNVSDVPPVSSVFRNDTAPPVFKMGEPVIEPVVSSSIASSVSAPIEIGLGLNTNQFNQSFVSESPPVFKGFFTDSSDPFTSSIQQQFNITSNTFGVEQHDDVVDSSPKEGTTQLNDSFQSQENFKVETVNQSSVITIEELNQLKLKLIEKENEIQVLKDQVEKLNLDIQSFSFNLDSDKNNLISANHDLSVKIEEYKSLQSSHVKEIEQLKLEINEMKNHQVNEVEQLRNNEEVRQRENESERLRNNDIHALKERMDEEMRQAERNYQSLLLNKDEENSHLICEVSSKQAICDKLTTQLHSTQSQLSAVQNEFISTKASYETQINSLKLDLDRLNFDIGELRKIKENDSQIYSSQVDYLQLSVQEKDLAIENLNARCNQLSAEVSRLQDEVTLTGERSNYLEDCYATICKSNEDQSSMNLALQDRLRVTSEEVEQLNLRIVSLSQELNMATANLEQEKLTNESLKSKEADQVGFLASEIEALQSSITEKDLEIERLSKLLTGLQERLIKAEESKISDEVLRLRGKLDDALYTVHLRDVRCDELTLEIMQLLSERDALQLRLSEAIRSNECLKTTSVQSNLPAAHSLTESKSPNDLTNKMDELHTGYMKDPGVKVDRENRHTQQMHLFTSNDPSGVNESQKQDQVSSDYGIFSWFFNSSTPPQANQEQST